LAKGQPVRLVSTQVVEAGVDLDFPEVWRAIGPLDRIVQAAGRCNREGRAVEGRVVVFEPTGGRTPRGPYQAGIEEARLLLKQRGADALNDPKLYGLYFKRLFSVVDVDKRQIQTLRGQMDYPEVASRYRLINDDTVPVVVPYGKATRQLEAWCRAPSRASWQRLQPYVVDLYVHDAQRLDGWLEQVSDGLYRWLGSYDKRRGLSQAIDDPRDLVPADVAV
jgi:CRISPR-associated endonuclease/helicase Cas3